MKLRKRKNGDGKEVKDTDDEEEVADTPKLKCRREPLPMKMRALPQSFWQQPNSSGVHCSTSFCPSLDEEEPKHSPVVGKANTDLLFSLFKGVKGVGATEKPPFIARRGRPRKFKDPKAHQRRSKDDDPFVTSAIVPQIQMQDEEVKVAKGQQVLAMISMTDDTAASMNMQFNSTYSQRLSDLVVNL